MVRGESQMDVKGDQSENANVRFTKVSLLLVKTTTIDNIKLH